MPHHWTPSSDTPSWMSSSGTISFLLDINFSLGKTLRALDSPNKVNGFTGNSNTDNF